MVVGDNVQYIVSLTDGAISGNGKYMVILF